MFVFVCMGLPELRVYYDIMNWGEKRGKNNFLCSINYTQNTEMK